MGKHMTNFTVRVKKLDFLQDTTNPQAAILTTAKDLKRANPKDRKLHRRRAQYQFDNNSGYVAAPWAAVATILYVKPRTM